MRKLASIVRISSITPVENSDRLSIAHMDGKGWQVVVGNGDFKPGDLAVYFEIDSFLPADDKRYEFLRDRCIRFIKAKDGTLLDQGIRIKTVRLRGALSQGLLIPATSFPEIRADVGSDVTEALHVRHFDEVCESYADLIDPGHISGDIYGSFPSVIPKTDEERIQNLVNLFEEARGRLFEVTVKADGTSITMAYSPSVNPERPFMVCSRNNDLKPMDCRGKTVLPWKIAESIGLEAKMKELYETTGRELAIQGELVGIGIQSNRDKLNCNKWLVFRIFDVNAAKYLSPSERYAVCMSLGLDHVEIVDDAMDVFERFHTVDELLKFAEGKTANGHEREGLVFKSCDSGPFISFKAVSNRYLLKQEG